MWTACCYVFVVTLVALGDSIKASKGLRQATRVVAVFPFVVISIPVISCLK
jgi:hypothetical protein